MIQPTMNDRIQGEINRLKKAGKPFSPADVAYRLKTTPRSITQSIRDRSDVYRISRSTGDRGGYKRSQWGFRQEATA